MPLFKEWNPGMHSLAAIWHITEPETFFLEQVTPSTIIRNDKRRIEHLAGRYLLRHLREDFPLHAIVPNDQDKPVLPDENFQFSVSHSWPYAAAMIHTKASAGIDLQCWHERILSIQDKFLAPAEQQFTGNEAQLVTLAWCAKEAAYKYLGQRGTDFIAHLPIRKWECAADSYNISININTGTFIQPLNLKGLIFPDFALSFTVDN